MDFNARQYDPQIGRFLSVDPLADAGGQQLWSPYAAMGNAPESMVDSNGTQAAMHSMSLGESNAPPHPMDEAISNYYGGLTYGSFAWSGGFDNGANGFILFLYGENAQKAWAQLSGQKYDPNGIVRSGTTEGELKSQGYMIDANDGTSISYHKNVQGDPNDITTLHREEGVVLQSGSGKVISFFDNLAQNVISSLVQTTTSVAAPIINQASIIAHEGVHEGSPRYPSSRVSWAIPYKFKNWKFVPQKRLMTSGDLSKKEGVELMNSTVSTVTTTFGIYGLIKGPAFYFFN